MRRIILLFFMAWFLSLLPRVHAEAGQGVRVSSKELIDRAQEMDGRPVVFQGEVIGDIMPRRAVAWFNVRDQHQVIGIFAPRELVKDIVYRGNYDYRGDEVEVEGIFFRAAADLGGEFCIVAKNITIIQSGFLTPHPVSPMKRNLAVWLFGLVLCLFAVRAPMIAHLSRRRAS